LRVDTSELPPGPRLPRSVQTYVMYKRPFTVFERCRARYGARFTLNTTSYPSLVVLSDAQDVKAMFAAAPDVLRAGEGARILEPIVGERSFMLHDDHAHVQGRRALLHEFRKAAVCEHAEMVRAVARRVIASWPLGKPFSLHASLRSLTLEVILQKVYNQVDDTTPQELYNMRDAILEMMEITGSSSLQERTLRRTVGRMRWRRFLRERELLDELIHPTIDEYTMRTDRPEGLLGRFAWDSVGSPERPQLLRDNLMSVISAGHETTAAQLAWGFQLLAHNPRAQAQLHREIACGESDVYLTATVQEIMRDRPVFPFTIPRVVHRPTELAGWKLAPPAAVVGCLYLLHHDPVHFPAPHSFEPERFLNNPPPPQVWLPWGGGHKRCPGLHLATMEMKVVLHEALAHLTVRPVADHIERPRWRSAIVTPHAGSRVHLDPREPGQIAIGRSHIRSSSSDRISQRGELSHPSTLAGHRSRWRRM
jgi:cytochrome P450